jgi:hypothetical protein
METLFYLCVDMLHFIADVTHLTYKEVNVIIFCFLWPAYTVLLYRKAYNKKTISSS